MDQIPKSQLSHPLTSRSCSMKDIWYIWCAVPGQNEWISRNKSSDLILSNVRDNSSNSEYSFHTSEENIAGQVFPNLMETVSGSCTPYSWTVETVIVQLPLKNQIGGRYLALKWLNIYLKLDSPQTRGERRIWESNLSVNRLFYIT